MSSFVTGQADGISILDALDDDALVEVLRAAKASRTLRALASTSWKLCMLARSRVALRLFLSTPERASLLLESHVIARAPFSGCTQLHFTGYPGASRSAVGVMGIISSWTALRHLSFSIDRATMRHRPQWRKHDANVGRMLRGLPSLQQLQNLELDVPAFGTSCAGHVGQLVQLTALSLSCDEAATHAAADLVALLRLTRLGQLSLEDPPALQPAAAGGPYCLPSSLTSLRLDDGRMGGAGRPWGPGEVSLMPYWYTHLPGCPQLQHLELVYGGRQHSSAHPSNLVAICAQHNKQLRVIKLESYVSRFGRHIDWGWPLPDLPAADDPPEFDWGPDADLASLTGLECLDVLAELHISTVQEWQRLAQLTRLTGLAGVRMYTVPCPEAGEFKWLTLGHCYTYLGGFDLGRLLNRFPSLRSASLSIREPIYAQEEMPAGKPFCPHPNLSKVQLRCCSNWGDAVAAAADFHQLSGVLGGVTELSVRGWPLVVISDAAGHAAAGGTAGGGAAGNPVAERVLPHLSACSALVALDLVCEPLTAANAAHATPPVEAYVSMLLPLKQLTSLRVSNAPAMGAYVVGGMQDDLPQLQLVELNGCGERLRPAGHPGHGILINPPSAYEQAGVAYVQQMLRPGLRLTFT